MSKNKLQLALINCGFVNTFLANRYLAASEYILNSLVKKNILNCNNCMLFGKVSKIYTLSNTSIYKLRNQGVNLYKHDITQIEHDYLLLQTFCSLTYSEQSKWQNETSIKQTVGRNTTTCDGLFIDDNNNIVGVEIFTVDYTTDKINEKISFMEKYCDKYITFNTKDFLRR